MTKIIAISNQKGGVAKTTTCVSLGACLAELNQSVLLIDLDPQAHLTVSLGLKPENLRRAVDDALLGYTSLIDCPPSFNTLTLNGLAAADMLIIPVQCDYYAAYSLRHYMKMITQVREKMNPWLSYRVLVTMYDRRNKICQVILDQMQRGLNSALLNTIIEVDTKLRESPAFGQPITLYAPTTRGTEQYRALAKELMDYAER
jgi:chromosome partitioning protein